MLAYTFMKSENFTLEWVSVQNGSGLGLSLTNPFNVLITDSSFAQNQLDTPHSYCVAGNSYLYYQYIVTPNSLYKVDIIRSNSTLGLGGYRGGGLNIRLQLAKPYKVQFFVDSVILYGNSGQCGANFYFYARYTDYESLIINNTISTYGNTFVPITTKSAYTGAGIYFFHFSSVGNIIIENTNISHNVAKKTGGVSVNWLFLGGSFELQNCIIHNNTGHIRSRMTLYVYEYFQVSVSATQPYINLDNILFDSNQVLDVSSEFEAAIVLSNVLNVTIKQIQVNNHNTAGLLSLRSQVYFVGHSQFVNNTGIYGGGVTTGVIQLTEYLTNMTPSYYGLTAQCTNVTYVFNITNASLTTIKVYATLESPIDPLKDPMGKIIEATIEACPIGFKLNSGTCGCRSELSTYDDISCDINIQTQLREGNLWIGYDIYIYINRSIDIYISIDEGWVALSHPLPFCFLYIIFYFSEVMKT